MKRFLILLPILSVGFCALASDGPNSIDTADKLADERLRAMYELMNKEGSRNPSKKIWVQSANGETLDNGAMPAMSVTGSFNPELKGGDNSEVLVRDYISPIRLSEHVILKRLLVANPLVGVAKKTVEMPAPKVKPEVSLEDSGRLPWSDAISYQSKVSSCTTRDCFDKVMRASVNRAKQGLAKAMQNVDPELRVLLDKKCTQAYPQKAHCLANHNFLLSKSAEEVLEKKKTSGLSLSSLISGRSQLLTEITQKLCSGVRDTQREDCLEGALQQLQSDGNAAAPLFRDSYYDMAEFSVNSRLCERGTAAVFEPALMAKHPELKKPSNLDWKGLGINKCGLNDLAESLGVDSAIGYYPSSAEVISIDKLMMSDSGKQLLESIHFNGKAEDLKEIDRKYLDDRLMGIAPGSLSVK